MKKYDVLISGYVSMDRIIKVLSPLKVGFTSLVENSDNAKICYGGCSVDIAYELTRLGLNVAPYIRVGEDYKDTGFYDFLKGSGICMDAIEVVPNETTSNSYMLEDLEGNHITVFYPGAMDGKYAAKKKDKFFERTKLGVITVDSSPDNQEFLKKCKKHKVPVVFGMKSDFNAFSPSLLKEILEYSKIVFVNKSEREKIEGLYNMISITELFETGNTEIIVVTLGKAGSICYQKIRHEYTTTKIRAAHCTKVVDTTGSGDAYISGFLYGYLNGYEPIQCCNMGSVLSAFIIEKMGCCTNAPNEAQLIERYKKFLKKGE